MPLTEDIISAAIAEGGGLDAALSGYVSAGNEEYVRAFIAKGASVHTRNSEGLTLLMQASRKGFAKIVGILLANGANIDEISNGVNNSQSSALHLAAYYGQIEVVRTLLENGANYQLQTNSNGTALMETARRGINEIVDVILGYMINPGERLVSIISLLKITLITQN